MGDTMRWILAACAGVLTGTAVGTPTAAMAQAVAIESATTGKCLDLPNGSTANGTRLLMFDCVATSANQGFEWGPGNSLRIFGKCVDAQGGQLRQGDAVAIWECNGGANQVWTLGADGQMRLGSSALCLDVEGDNRGNGARLVVWGCGGYANQKFRSRLRQAASAPAPARTPVELWDLPRLRGDLAAALANASPLNNTSALNNASALNNTSAFTMPMGNNFTLPTGCGGVSCDRTTQALQRNVAGVLHVMGAANVAALQCVAAQGSTALLQPPRQCALIPDQSIWIFGNDRKIRWFDRATEKPSERCLTVVRPGGAGTQGMVQVASCGQAVTWMNHPSIADALSQEGDPQWVVGMPAQQRAFGGPLMTFPAPANLHLRWALLPVPKTMR